MMEKIVKKTFLSVLAYTKIAATYGNPKKNFLMRIAAENEQFLNAKYQSLRNKKEPEPKVLTLFIY
jgi:hypothetical protein